MTREVLSTRIDSATKAAFTHICDQLGLSTSQAIKVFAKAVVNTGGIPFELKVHQANELNATTIAAMQELESGQGLVAENINQLLDDLTEHKVSRV